ncbi:TA system VapC family ribonuclease toxin [Iamia sp.]|uniref:TA system VapC family ribonuclease toxin n=1 Tax=Iamia sp. TaxID=2722710 RepID=UPI002BABEC57|nr:TA system VapC family ribonuclease toxin [Iamia sp.]HXH56728.1 TA system VapC family ribonuclease toxin [Iamia sp.]
MLVDANLLVYAVDLRSPRRDAARSWFSDALNGENRVALPWISLGAFVRVVTHPRILANPISIDQAWSTVEGWLALDNVWTPNPGQGHAPILGRLLRSTGATGNLVTDAQLAALALEHGLTVASADSDFARFPEVRWHNPLH